MMLDTGSAISAVSRNLADKWKQMGAIEKSSSLRIRTADGLSSATGEIHGILKFYGHSIKQRFYVIPNLLRSLVVGRDFIYNARIWICIYNSGWGIESNNTPLCRFDQDEPELCLIEKRDKTVEETLDEAVENSNLSFSFKERFRKLLHSYADVFSKTQKITTMIEHNIEVKSEKPFQIRLTQLSEEKRRILCDLVKQMEEQGILERGPTQFVSCPIVHKKKNSEYKCVLDARWVNDQTEVGS